MKLILKVVAGFLCMIAVAQAESVAPDVMIQNTADEVISIVKQDSGSKADNQKKIFALVDAKILPHFDFEKMTDMALATNRNKPTAEQKKALVAVFRNMLVRTYTKAFTEYRDQKIKVLPLKLDANAVKATVMTKILKPGSQPTDVNYQMINVGGEWKVVDVEISGVKLVVNYRNQFNTKIQESGVDGLIKFLADMNVGADPVHKADAK